MILVVNLKDFGSLESIVSRFPKAEVVYIGRAMPNIKASVLGNPFRMNSEAEREVVIEQYRQWLWQQKKADAPAWHEVLRLSKLEKDIVLVCWCAPKRCHGDVVKSAIEWVRSTQQPG